MSADLPLWVTVPGSILLVVGGLAALAGALGLLRLPTFYARMHVPGLAATGAAACVLTVSMLVTSALLGRPVLREILIGAFLVTTMPVSAMLLMRAAMRRTAGMTPRR
ncbi:MAG TPA: monovalent cation/H(+) antiporter subunit G [Gammaproteobacteria bacterium]|nr:monovalent cation/H(+) antiporter subunit G [Gammaproteobacteria bacterium]